MNRIIKYSQIRDYKKLFCDFVSSPDTLQQIYQSASFSEVTSAIDKYKYRRDVAIDILIRQNRNWHAPDAVLAQIKRLSNEKSLTVFTGQQACLLGGPYMVLLKALTAISEARRLEDELKRPVIPIFWIASDDHDFEEISHVHVYDGAGAPAGLQLDIDPDRHYPPMGKLEYGEDISREIGNLIKLLGNSIRYDDVIEATKKIFIPRKPIADAFAEFLMRMVGHLGLVCFSPCDRDFKTAVADAMVSIVEKNEDIKEALHSRNDLLVEQGYRLQVEKSDSAVYLFEHQPERMAIHIEGDKYKAGDRVYSHDDLIEKVKNEPFNYSPDVLTRPLLQSSFFPVIEIIGGPAEIAYWIQMMPFFEMLDLPTPHIKERMSATVMEPFVASFMESKNISYTEIAGDFERVISERLQEDFPQDIAGLIPLAKERARADMESLREKLLQFDPGLEGMIDKTGTAIDWELSNLEKKLIAAHKKKNKAEREKYRILKEYLFPEGKAAERMISPVSFLVRHGWEWIDRLYEQLDKATRGHQLIEMKNGHG